MLREVRVFTQVEDSSVFNFRSVSNLWKHFSALNCACTQFISVFAKNVLSIILHFLK